ncbi:MAG: helix-turn-helix domain-containing protein [Desulfobulbaceae bacterium]|jgi:DNA-binding XRE family transcriptional regulator|nr:helix-turn-helix domain-containing protein [Desulfobulbaceae bacterium]
MNVQIIEMKGNPAFAVVPVSEWESLLARLEELQDLADARGAAAGESFPVELADRLLAGDPPLRVWREYRGFTLQALAEACGVSRQMLSMIEHGKTAPSASLLSRLASALRCDMDDLHA